jgi:hypothetical protein
MMESLEVLLSEILDTWSLDLQMKGWNSSTNPKSSSIPLTIRSSWVTLAMMHPTHLNSLTKWKMVMLLSLDQMGTKHPLT